MTFCFSNDLHKWNSQKAFGLCCQPANRTIRLTLTENFIWKSICTNLFLECSMLVTYVCLWKFRLFSWFLVYVFIRIHIGRTSEFMAIHWFLRWNRIWHFSDVIDSISQIALEFPLFSSTRVINPRDYLLKRRYGNYLAKRTHKIRIDWASETRFWFCSQFHS